MKISLTIKYASRKANYCKWLEIWHNLGRVLFLAYVATYVQAHNYFDILILKCVYVVIIPLTRVVFLICTPEARTEGGHISPKPQVCTYMV